MCSVGNGRGNGARSEEGMVDDFVEGRAFLRVGSENLLDEVSDFGGDETVRGELVFIVTNTPAKGKCKSHDHREIRKKQTCRWP